MVSGAAADMFLAVRFLTSKPTFRHKQRRVAFKKQWPRGSSLTSVQGAYARRRDRVIFEGNLAGGSCNI